MNNRRNIFFIISFIFFGTFLFNIHLVNAQVESKQTLHLVDASSNNFPPMNVLDKDGELTGFGRELSDAVIKELGGEIEHIHSSNWLEVLKWLDTGKADFIHDTGYTKDRDKFLDYSEPIMEMPETIFVRPEEYSITNLDSLKGKKVACVNKHITHLYLQQFPEISLFVVETTVEGIYELISGKVDAFVYPRQIVLYLAQHLRLQDKIKITGESLRTLTWSMVVKEGNVELLQRLNEGIAKVRKSGQYDRIYEKWWGKKVLSGYTKEQLIVFTIMTTGICLAVILSITLFVFSRKLKQKVKENTASLRQEKEFIKAVLENIEDGIVACDKEGILTLFNRATREFHSLPEKPISAEEWPQHYDLFLADGITLMEKKDVPLFCALQGTHVKDIEMVISPKQGENRILLASGQPLLDDHGNILGAVVSLHDVTERKHAEEALRKVNDELEVKIKMRTLELQQSETRMSLLVNQSPMGIITWDENFRVVDWNKASENIFGYSHEEATGKLAKFIVPMEDRKHVDKIWGNLLELEGGKRSTNENINKDGETILCEWFNTPVVNHRNEVINVLSLVQDITEQKKLERQLRQAMKMEAIGTLAGGIAHDFNNILSAILGYSELARAEMSDNDPIAKHLDQVLIAGKRATELVRQILTFSRQGKEDLRPLQVQLIIKEALKLLRSSLPTTIQLKQDIADNAGLILADPTQIHQVLMNLCTNAKHAIGDESGTLSISLSEVHVTDSDTIADCPQLAHGSYLDLTINDTGCGMDSLTSSKIFDPFFTTKEKGKGTGLGLAVVHGIIKQHKGEITVASEPNQGTTFHIYLPVIEEEMQAKQVVNEDLPRGNERILFVDDETAIANMMQQILTGLGYTVTVFTSSIEALDAYENNPEDIDLVVTDMTMPEMTGVDLSRKLLALQPNLPIILCTGFSESVDEIKAKSIGISEYIKKPVNKATLAKAIRAALKC